MARKKKHPEHENLERWLVSYADFMTLLFAFFVVMYSISSVNEGKYRIVSDTVANAFNKDKKVDVTESSGGVEAAGEAVILSTETAGGDSLLEMPFEARVNELARKQIDDLGDKIERSLEDLISGDNIKINRTGDWINVQIKSEVLFGSGSAVLEESAYPIMAELATVLREVTNPMRVEGFTDNVPIKTATYPSNWELSAARAASVVHLFEQEGMDPERMAAIGYSQFHPIADNTTADGRRKNRRIELKILADKEQARKMLTELEDTRTVLPLGVAPKPTPPTPLEENR